MSSPGVLSRSRVPSAAPVSQAGLRVIELLIAAILVTVQVASAQNCQEVIPADGNIGPFTFTGSNVGTTIEPDGTQIGPTTTAFSIGPKSYDGPGNFISNAGISGTQATNTFQVCQPPQPYSTTNQQSSICNCIGGSWHVTQTANVSDGIVTVTQANTLSFDQQNPTGTGDIPYPAGCGGVGSGAVCTYMNQDWTITLIYTVATGAYSLTETGMDSNNYTLPDGTQQENVANWSFSTSGAWTVTSGIKALINGVPDTNTFTMHPSVTTSTLSPYGSGPQNELIQLSCVDSSNKGIPGCMFDFGASATPGSGGHVHNDDRPVGPFKSSQCVTAIDLYSCVGDDDGNVLLTYTAPEASGITMAQGSVSTNGDSRDFSFTINIQIDGLARLSGNNPIVDTFSHNHGDNNGWASPATNAALNSMVAKFAQNLFMLGPYPVPPIEIDAISLPLGGLFDYSSLEWSPPHKSHRFGNDADVCMKPGADCGHGLTPQQRKALSWAAWFAGFQTPVPGEQPGSEANHWHLVIGP